MTHNPQTTFVCCVESGWLEQQAIRMIESLRRWGGCFADAPVYAVTPRFGPPLARSTHASFERLDVNYLRFQANNRYAWKSFLNKHYALAAVEEICGTTFVGWLDSDLLIVGEPSDLQLTDEEDFVACAPDKNIGVSSSHDPSYPYWTVACETLGMNIEEFPWVVTHREQARIRMYWNSGVFVYRRSTGFAKPHLEMTLQLMNAHLASKHAGVFFTQHTLGMAVLNMGLRWRALPHSHNYGLGSKTYDLWNDPKKIQAAKILHYHDAMWPNFWETLLESLAPQHPLVVDWLRDLGPISNQSPIQWRLMSKALQTLREQKSTDYRKLCRVV